MKRLAAPATSAARHSAALIDALVCPIQVDRTRLAAALPPIDGLSLAPGRGRGKGKTGGSHPVRIEVWRVRDGRVEAAGLDVHGWSNLAGAAAGLAVGGASGGAVGATFGGVVGAAGGGVLGLALGPAGLLFGALAGSVAGLWTGAAFGAAGSAAYGAGLLGAASRRLSETGSRMLGTYGEILVTTPCVLETARGPLLVAFVLAMYTDSRISRSGEAALGFAFGKRPARILVDGGRLEVQAITGASLLRISLRARRTRQPVTSGGPAAAHVRASAATPLLGERSGRVVLSRLERDLDDRAVRLWPAHGRVELGRGFVSGVPAGGHTLTPLSGRSARGAFVATNLPVHLSYPQPLRPLR